MNCIFCKIINQELNTTIHDENEHLFVIDDISPQAPIHRLIIPKRHIATLNELTPPDFPLIAHMYTKAVTMATALNIADTGYRLVTNCNSDGGQTVFHIHMHFMAGRAFHWPPG